MTEQEKADIALLERGGRTHNMFMTLPLERRTTAVCRRAVEIDGENIRYVPRDMRTEKLCYTAVQSWDYALDYVPEELKTPSMCKAAVERYGPALLFVPQERRTEALCEAAVKNDAWALSSVPDRLKTEQMCMDAVAKDGWVLEFVPQAIKTPQMCREALNAPLARLRENRSVLQFIPYADVCLEGMKKYRQEGADMVGLLADIEPEVIDERIALYGVQSDPSCLMTLPERWKTETVCEAAVSSSIHALQYVPGALHTPDLYREAMENDPAAIQYFKPELLTREMCYEALYSNDDLRVLRYIPYKEIHEQLLERCEGYSQTKHFLDNMNPDYLTPKLAEMIFTKEPELFFNIPGKCKDRELCETAVRYNGSYLRMVPEIYKTPELCMAAIRRSPFAIQFIPEAMKSPDLYMNLVKENPQNLYGIPEDDRTYEMCKMAFDNTYGKDKTDYSVAGALTEPSMALQMVWEQDNPKTIDFLITVMRPKAISEEVAMEAVRKNGRILHLVPKEVITQQVGEAAVRNQPQSIQWVPHDMRTADMCLYAFKSDSELDIYTPDRIKCEDNIYTFARKVDEELRQPLSYDGSKRLYGGGIIRLQNVETDIGTFADCEVRYDRKSESLTLRNLTPRQERTRPVKPQRKSFMKPKF